MIHCSCWCIWVGYPLVTKRGNGKFAINGGLNGKIIYKQWISNCYVWLWGHRKDSKLISRILNQQKGILKKNGSKTSMGHGLLWTWMNHPTQGIREARGHFYPATVQSMDVSENGGKPHFWKWGRLITGVFPVVRAIPQIPLLMLELRGVSWNKSLCLIVITSIVDSWSPVWWLKWLNRIVW